MRLLPCPTGSSRILGKRFSLTIFQRDCLIGCSRNLWIYSELSKKSRGSRHPEEHCPTLPTSTTKLSNKYSEHNGSSTTTNFLTTHCYSDRAKKPKWYSNNGSSYNRNNTGRWKNEATKKPDNSLISKSSSAGMIGSVNMN